MSASFVTNQIFGDAALRANLARFGNTPEVGSSLAAPLQLGPWRLESLVKEGMLTRIYRARSVEVLGDVHSPPPYVIKVLREVWQEHPVALARMRQQALVGRCVAHRHIAPVLSVHVHRSPYYVVLPWLAGNNVAALLAARGGMNAPLALWIVRQAAQALHALHTAGYVHGDVKPGNLLLAADGHVSLLDLSCSRRIYEAGEFAEPTLTDQPLLGTPKYLAPEMFFGRRIDARSDLHSLGLTLYEILAGRLPEMPDDMAGLVAFKRSGSLPHVRAFAPQTPPEVAELVRCLTARDPLRRPDTAHELVQRLLRLEIATLRQRVPMH
jgi:eukaryotic-like serine/threonine-protein kinase